jgi:hypothetical protein
MSRSTATSVMLKPPRPISKRMFGYEFNLNIGFSSVNEANPQNVNQFEF